MTDFIAITKLIKVLLFIISYNYQKTQANYNSLKSHLHEKG